MKRRTIAKRVGGTAVLYLRVSSAIQVDGLSLDVQRERLEAYCTAKGLAVGGIIVDEAQSAYKPLAKRPGGRAVLDLIAKGSVDSVVVYKLDRAFRNTADCLTTVESWDRRGVSLHLVDMGGSSINTTSATGKMFLTLMAGFAEFERSLGAERTALVLASKAAKGERLGGSAPYGYMHVDGRLVAHEAEQAVVARVRELKAAGASLRKTSALLGPVSRVGAPFSPEQLTRMLNPPARVLRAA